MSKTQKPQKTTYHHGNLRQTLLEEAYEIIRQEGMDKLTMRSLSDRAGVSRSALYHHFKDKSDLIKAIAEKGYLNQMETITRIFDDPSHSLTEKLESFVLEYIHFAADNPDVYQLMFSRDIWKDATSDQLNKTARSSFRMYAELLTKLNQKGAITVENPLRTAQVTWGTLHGLACLLIDGIFVRKEDLEEIAKYGLHQMLQSLTIKNS